MRVSDEDLQQAIDEKVFGSDIGGGFVERVLLDLYDLRAAARAVSRMYHKACMSRGVVGVEHDAIEALRAEVESNEMNAK
jgi:CBS-domain-containing membrane protein